MYYANEDNNRASDVERERYPSKPQSDTANSMVDMIMGASTGSSANSGEAQQITVDTKTLIAQTQDRMWKALKRRYQYDSNLNPAQMFLLNHINSKIPLCNCYVHLPDQETLLRMWFSCRYHLTRQRFLHRQYQ